MRGITLFLIFLIIPAVVMAQTPEQRFEAGVLLTGGFLRGIGTRDAGVGTDVAGFGGRFVYLAIPFVDLESELNFLPGNSATSGNHLQGLFGVKIGPRWERFGIFVKARPGFMHFRRDPFGVGRPGSGPFSQARAASTESSIDLGGVAEYYLKRGPILRFDLGKAVVRYDKRVVRTSDFVPEFEAGGFTTRNWQASFGVSFRF
jgi:hypothetical protein